MPQNDTDAFVEAYNKSRYWRGINDIVGAMRDGLRLDRSISQPGAGDPGMRQQPSGSAPGMICLAARASTAAAFGTLLRVFLNRERGGELLGNAAECKANGRFAPGNPGLCRDTDQDASVATWADIPANWLWRYTLKELARGNRTNARVRAIFLNIGSFMEPPCRDVGLMQGWMRTAVRDGRLVDDVSEVAGNRNWIVSPPKDGERPVPRTGTGRNDHGCIIL